VSLSRNDSIGSVVLAASSSARPSLFARYGPSIGPRLAFASSCERIRDAIPFLPTESFRLNRRRGRSVGGLVDSEDAKGPNFESGRVGIFRFHGWPGFLTESRLNEGLEGCLATDSKGLGLHQKVIGNNQARFHKRDNLMGVRTSVDSGLSARAGCWGLSEPERRSRELTRFYRLFRMKNRVLLNRWLRTPSVVR